jgi:pSer/pThr/pTyr-binding forkhead associated (FHA) protein
MDLGTALVGGAVGLVSGLVTAYAAMRFRLREERAKWARELALKYATARADSGAVASSIAEQFGTCLVIVNEPGQGRQKHFLLPGTRLVVGGGPNVEIRIAEKAASQRHMGFELREAGAFVVDFHTVNGTWLNGTRIVDAARLESGDVVTIGETRITFLAL